MGFTMGTKQLVITPMRILVRLVLNRTFLETISRFSAILSAIGCTFVYITGDTARAVSPEYVLQCVCCSVCVAVCVLQCVLTICVCHYIPSPTLQVTLPGPYRLTIKMLRSNYTAGGAVWCRVVPCGVAC